MATLPAKLSAAVWPLPMVARSRMERGSVTVGADLSKRYVEFAGRVAAGTQCITTAAASLFLDVRNTQQADEVAAPI
jgi:hypothetical protein